MWRIWPRVAKMGLVVIGLAAKHAGGPTSCSWSGDALVGNEPAASKKLVTPGGYRDEPKWASIHNALIDAMIRLEKAL